MKNRLLSVETWDNFKDIVSNTSKGIILFGFYQVIMKRRKYLAIIGATGISGAIAGCAGAEEDEELEEDTPEDDDTERNQETEETQQEETSQSSVVVKVENEEGEPIKNAQIELIRGGSTINEGTTGDNGRYEFEELDAEEYFVEVSHDTFFANNQRLELNEGSVEITITLSEPGPCEEEDLIHETGKEVSAGDTIGLSPELGREDELFIQAEEVSSARPKVELFDDEDNSLLEEGPSEEIQELYTVESEGSYRIEFENEALLTTGTWNFRVTHRTATCDNATPDELSQQYSLIDPIEHAELIVEDALESNSDFDEIQEIDVSSSEEGLTVEASSNYMPWSAEESEFRDVVADILEDVFESDADVHYFEISIHGPTVDEYGEEGFARALTVGMYEETAENINWDNYDSENLSRHAEIYNLNYSMFD